jgi:hypothetical protein
MERLDGIVGGLGVLVVAVALLGVAVSAPIAPGAQAFHVAFPEHAVPQPDQSGTIAGDGSHEFPVPIGARNLTRVTFALDVSAPGPRALADTVTMTLQRPDGRTQQQTGTLGNPAAASLTLTLDAPVGSPPAERDVRAPSSAAALAQVAGLASANGTGTWTVTVQVQSQGGAPLGPAHTEPHQLTLRVAAVVFEAVVQPPQPAR